MEGIAKELVVATNIPLKAGEDNQLFLGRLVKAVSEVSDDTWDKLSLEAQNWYNNAVDESNAKRPFPELPGMTQAESPARRRVASESKAAETPTQQEPSTSAEEKTFTYSPGTFLELVTMRGTIYRGTVLEHEGDNLTVKLESGGKELFKTSRLAQVKPGEPRTKEEKAADKEKPKAAPVETARPSVTQRIREITCTLLSPTKEAVMKQLQEESYEFKPSTLDITFTDTMKVVECLQAAGRLK